ncbi:beta-propeller domain-containing protein [Actinomadura hibisca]|uniref:beta-propeller domain-containing protein n=1 Tax=Actinomadura hibisca TaxID=68565 RepID=UPI000829A8E0|nr:beta-propeller domain-containing protein [Actinomadura hibisca]
MSARVLAPALAVPLLVAGCATKDGGRPPVTAPPMRLVAYDGCSDLLDGLREATAKQVTPYGLGALTVEKSDAQGAVPPGAAARAEQAAPSGPPPEHSRTNAHEADADEPDQVKTDGRRIVTVAQGRLNVIDPATRKVVHKLALPGSGSTGGDPRLLLHGDRVLVLSDEFPQFGAARPLYGPARQLTRLTLVDLSGTPKVVGSMTGDAAYVDARQTGATARVVIRSTPTIEFPSLPHGRGAEQQAVERNRAIVRKAPLSAWLPSFQVGNGSKTTVPCDRVSHAAGATGTSVLTVLTLDLTRPLGDPDPVSVAAEGQTVYATGRALYVTGTPPRPLIWNGRPQQAQPDERTDIHMFSLPGTGRPRYEASGSVPGGLLNQYSMSDDGTHLRVATTSGNAVPGATGGRSQSAVRVLRRDGSALKTVGTIDGLGKGERIYSVRFLGTAAYVVTFRQTDPLYVVDLKDPAKPRVTGELKINGYSAYLHPTAPGRLLGVGQDADSQGRVKGTQVSLFDVSAAPRRVGVHHLPRTGSDAEFDPHAFLYWPKTGLTVLPVRGHTTGDGTARALVLKIDGDAVRRVGEIAHPGRQDSITRSLMVGDTLWTFSPDGARATETTTGTVRAGTWLAY